MGFSSRWHRLLFVCSCLLLLVGSMSCANPMSIAAGPNAVVSPTPTPVSTPTSPTSTAANLDCPPSGQGRAANMPGIRLGNQQEIVFYHNADGSATIQEFGVQDKTSSTIARMSGETIHAAQLSQDGHWVLIVAEMNDVWALQLVRVDAQDLQTLYCSSPSQQLVAQWSPNQQQIIFSQISTQETQLLLLKPTSGMLQVEYVEDTNKNGDMPLEPITWLDNSRVYIGILESGLLYEPANLYVLDTNKGTNQQQRDLTLVRGIGDNQWSFDCSLDGKTIYSTSGEEPPQADALKSAVYAEPALSGDSSNPIFVSTTLFLTGVRVMNATTLMILAEDPGHPQSSANGLYTIHTDGSGFKHLASSPAQQSVWPLNAFSQYTWSNFSRNGAYYVDGLSYGSFNGGSLATYGSLLGGDTPVGWTTK